MSVNINGSTGVSLVQDGVIVDADIVTLAASKLTGALPAISGASLTGIAAINLGTEVATTSGTSIDFTGIPAGVKRVSMMLAGVSVNGTSSLLVQIGTSGGIQTSGYVSTYSYTGPSQNGFQTTIGFGSYSDTASAEHHGTFTLSLEKVSNGSWTFIGGTARQTDAHHFISSGGRVLSGTLDRIRLTTINGTDTFDAGSVNISWES